MNLDERIRQAPHGRAQALMQVRDFYLHSVAGPELQWGPSPDVCAQIQLGARPVDLAPELTRKEAAAWAYQDEHKYPEQWLWHQLRQQYPELNQSHTGYIEVMRWAARMLSSKTKSAAMKKPRAVFGEGEGEAEGDKACVLQRLDELKPQDLTNSPSETMQNAVNRQMREQWDGPDELRPNEPWMDRLPSGCRVLRTWPDLFLEGLQMRHCVANYARSVAEKQSVIISINIAGARSTAEFQQGRLVQHQSFARGTPSPRCRRFAEVLESGGYIP